MRWLRNGLIMSLLLPLAACIVVDEYEGAVYKGMFSGEVSESQGTGMSHTFFREYSIYDLREIEYPREGESERLQALTSDQLQIKLDAAYRYKIQREAVRDLNITVGGQDEVHSFVYQTFRSSTRDAVAEIAAADLLSKERAGIGERIEQLMTDRLSDRGIIVTEFFVRDIIPPERIRQAIEQKLAQEQQVQEEQYRTQVVQEQANQRREEAQGIRDAQRIIAESLVGSAGLRYLNWRYYEVLSEVAQGENNLVVGNQNMPIILNP